MSAQPPNPPPHPARVSAFETGRSSSRPGRWAYSSDTEGFRVAFVKLLPRGDALPVAEVVRRLQEEFAAFEADPDEGRDRVADMIVATLRLPDSVPHKRAQLAELQAVQGQAVLVTFGDDWHCAASCCVMPGAELFFDSRAELDGLAREAVERAAEVLGYDLEQG